MSQFDEGRKLIEDTCGQGKDNVISLATIAPKLAANEMPCPVVRDVDAFYEDGVFYATTHAKSNKVLQIESNPMVAFSVHFEGISGTAIAQNLGWVLAPQNTELRAKVRKAFADWYDAANNEQDQNCVILAIRISTATIFRDHGAVQYQIDFPSKTDLA